MSSSWPPELPSREHSDLLSRAFILARIREGEVQRALVSAQRVREAVVRVYGARSDQAEEWKHNCFLLDTELRSARAESLLLRALARPRSALEAVLYLYANLEQHIEPVTLIAPDLDIAIETFRSWDRQREERELATPRLSRANEEPIPPQERSRSRDRDERGDLADPE